MIDFATEAELCASFLDAVAKQQPGLRCYAEVGGWDILVVWPDGLQMGIQAKLKLNADVVCQAVPDFWCDGQGPDFRAILVPKTSNRWGNGLCGLAERLGLVVFAPDPNGHFQTYRWSQLGSRTGWTDWNPATRVSVPTTTTDSIAGSPCPVTLTQWKVAALRVIARLEVVGTITPTIMRGCGCDPRRWISGGWLVPTEERGVWKRGDHCPRFDQQHPTAYAAALQAEREAA